MSTITLLWHDYRYFPYERKMAEREATNLFGVAPISTEEGLVFKNVRISGKDAKRLTYFKAVQNGRLIAVPDQAKLEASGNGNGTAWEPARNPVPVLRRQTTRYSGHGLHEYRGKFNPQIVRVIGNVFQMSDRDWVLDPFCGSGTTLLESAHMGWNCVGLDLNPLAVFIANAKIMAFNTDPEVLKGTQETLTTRLRSGLSSDDSLSYLPYTEYLEKWFPVPVLAQIRIILHAIQQVNPAHLRQIFWVILSDICREVSLQEPADLRIRRRKDPCGNYPAIEKFCEACQTKITSVVRARQHIEPRADVVQSALHGDSRRSDAVLRNHFGNSERIFDAAVTSPPYATAMPYLDTQRLSLALFGLIGPSELREEEKALIGNREIQDKERGLLECQLKANAAKLPAAVITFCQRLLGLADDPSHGFRRRNVPALVYKYFSDMGSMFASVQRVIRRKGRFGLVVGCNSTVLKGEEVVIDTPELLAKVAESRQWIVEEMIGLDAYHRYDIHQKNSIREESLLVLRRR